MTKTLAQKRYTLTDLLVVVGAITLIFLLIYMLPTRSPDGRPQCMSNIREVSLAIFIYAQNYDYFPVAAGTSG